MADTGLTAQLRLNNADRQADRQTDTRQMLGAYRIVRSTAVGVQNVEKQFQIAGIRKHGTSFAVCLFSVANVALLVQKW